MRPWGGILHSWAGCLGGSRGREDICHCVGPVGPDPPCWVQTMDTTAQACPVGTHSTTREDFPGKGVRGTGGIDLGRAEQGPGDWDHSG